jgi:hypothetical protein
VGVNVLWVTLVYGVSLTIQAVLNTFLVKRLDHDVAFAISGVVLLFSGMVYLITCGLMLEVL